MNDTPVSEPDPAVAAAAAEAGLEIVGVERKTVIQFDEPEQKRRAMNRAERRNAGARRSAGRGRARRNLGQILAEGAAIERGERILEDEAHR